jgi:uncharacterized protein (TIGR03435 family)
MLFSAAIAGRSQPQTQQGSAPEFEVASVKTIVDAGGRQWVQAWPQRSPGRISWRARLDQLILYAYHLQPWQVTGLPSPGAAFQLDATSDVAATEGEIRLMLRSLLEKRFQLAAHYETKQLVGYSLTVGKGGIKLSPAKEGDPPAPLPVWLAGRVTAPQVEGRVFRSEPTRGTVAVTGRGVSIAELADTLQEVLGTFVLDKTSVAGKYYFGISFPGDDAPAVADAVQDLGLRLEKEKGPVKVLVIDHVEKAPTEN